MKTISTLFILFLAALCLAQTPGMTKSQGDARYGTPPTPATLGSVYGAAKGPSDILSSLPSGSLMNAWAITPQAPAAIVGTQKVYVNCCQSLSMTGWTVGTGTATIAVAAGHGVVVGDTIAITALPGGISGITIGTYTVSAVTSTSVTITCPTTTGTWTSGGTFYAVRNGMGPGSDSTGTGTFAAPYASLSGAQAALAASQSISGAAQSGGNVNFTVTSSAKFQPGNAVWITGCNVSSFNGFWNVVSIPDSTHITVGIGAAYVSGANAGTIWTAPGDTDVILNTGTYLENTGSGGAFKPEATFLGWVNFTSFTGQPKDVVIQNATANNPVINIQSWNAWHYQFSNVTIAENGTSNCLKFQGGSTNYGFHFYNCIFQEPTSTSSAQTFIQIGNSATFPTTSGVSSGTGGVVRIAVSSTSGLAVGNTVTLTSGWTGSSGSVPLNNSRWTVSALSANTYIELAGSTYASGMAAGTMYWQGTDTTFSDLAFVNCLFQSTGTNAYAPAIINVIPATNTGNNQPFSNFGFWNCQTALANQTNTKGVGAFTAGELSGINGLYVVGNRFTTYPANGTNGCAFQIGSDTSSTGSVNGGVTFASTVNAYVGCNYFNSLDNGGLSEAVLIGNNVTNAFVGFNYCLGGNQVMAVKGCLGVQIWRNFLTNSATDGPYLVGIKACTNTVFALNDMYSSSGTGTNGALLYEQIDTSAWGGTTKPTNTYSYGNWMIADSARNSTALLGWFGSSISSGFRFEDYNVYDVRGSGSWGQVGGTSVSSLATVRSQWALTGMNDGSTNDANSQDNSQSGWAVLLVW